MSHLDMYVEHVQCYINSFAVHCALSWRSSERLLNSAMPNSLDFRVAKSTDELSHLRDTMDIQYTGSSYTCTLLRTIVTAS